MTVLVAFATHHGSTREIAEAIAGQLRRDDVAADVRWADEVENLAGYEAVIIGSAVYYGRWMRQAHRFIEANADVLRERPVWLFSSGPLGDNPQPPGDPREIAVLVAASGARGHRAFAGKLERGTLGPFEKLVARVVRAPDGDYREWPQITAWTREIEDALRIRPPVSSARLV